MCRLAFMTFALALLGTCSPAQDVPKADISVGYSTIEVLEGYTFRMDGGSASTAWNVNSWLAGVADFGAYHGHPGVDLTTSTYTFGPRFSFRRLGRVVPFAQILAGGLHASAVTTGFTDATNSFAIGAGGGADIALDQRGAFAVRPQIEYFAFHGNNGTANNARLSIAFVYRFGAK